MKKDISEIEDVKRLVDAFYAEVREDELLKDIFERKIMDRWPQHLETMYRFWQTVLLHQHTYHGSPFPPHTHLPVEKVHFERWLELFRATVDRFFKGEKAEQAKWQGERMAEMFHAKISYFKHKHAE